jgi:hypothetical protein
MTGGALSWASRSDWQKKMEDEVIKLLRSQAASYRETAKLVHPNSTAADTFLRLAAECDRLAAEYERKKLAPAALGHRELKLPAPH